MNFKIYIINLDRDYSKKQDMIEKLKFFKNIEYEFIKGTDGLKLNNKILEEHRISINPFFRNPYCFNSITLGEIGCTISHIKAWEKANIDEYDYSIILEDDCIISKDFISVLNQLIYDQNIIESDFIYLGRKVFNNDELMVSENSSYKLVKPNFSYWTIGYMLTKSGIQKLINSKIKENIIPIDEFIPICYNKNSISYTNSVNLSALAIIPELITPKSDAFLESSTESSPHFEYYYNENFYDNKITLVSVASHKLDGYYRFLESTKTYGFPCHILGLNQIWNGNDMRVGTGGGQKVNLLKSFLKQFHDDDQRMILFSDCYDAVISNNPENILKIFKKHFDCDILFSAEPLLWPDKNLENFFPIVSTPYRFLNSGGFIGSIKNLKLLTKSEISDNSDDQLYYQKIYLESKKKNNLNTKTDQPLLKIELDYNSIIFQTLSSHLDYINIDFDKSKIRNDITDTYPSIIHGNGGIESKIFLSNLTNFINQRYRPCYGYRDNHSDLKKMNLISEIKYPKILFYLPLYSIKNIENINNILSFNYPLSNCKLVIINVNNINDQIIKNKCKIFINLINYEYINISQLGMTQRQIFTKTININYNYIFILNIDHQISYCNLIKYLICSNLDIVSPMILGKQNTMFSNFWGDIDQNGYYKRSFNYLNIIKKKEIGFWCVPYISGSILISKNKYSELLQLLNNNLMTEDICDFDMYLSRIIREHYNFMYISNFHDFGCILDD